jgi:hypothetical protein
VVDVFLRVRLVGDTRVVAEAADDLHLIGLEPRLNPERASGSTLAGTAVADRDSERIAFDFETKLPTLTGCVLGGHHGET